MPIKFKRPSTPVPAIVLLIIALIAIIYTEFNRTTGSFVGPGAVSGGISIGHLVALVCVMGTALLYFPRKK